MSITEVQKTEISYINLELNHVYRLTGDCKVYTRGGRVGDTKVLPAGTNLTFLKAENTIFSTGKVNIAFRTDNGDVVVIVRDQENPKKSKSLKGLPSKKLP